MSDPERSASSEPGRPRRRRAGEAAPPDSAARPREPLDVGPVDPPAPFPLVEVRNPSHATRYRVALPEFPERQGALCSCEDFSRRGKGTCKHIEAAWLALRAEPPTPLPAPTADWAVALWAEVDRRQSETLVGRPTDLANCGGPAEPSSRRRNRTGPPQRPPKDGRFARVSSAA
ncbi:MAG: hypothetical protein L3J87_01805 [Thermoplasmata archaeon]|nr:hypothetical protein [Thermoplasmata archaeon]